MKNMRLWTDIKVQRFYPQGLDDVARSKTFN